MPPWLVLFLDWTGLSLSGLTWNDDLLFNIATPADLENSKFRSGQTTKTLLLGPNPAPLPHPRLERPPRRPPNAPRPLDFCRHPTRATLHGLERWCCGCFWRATGRVNGSGGTGGGVGEDGRVAVRGQRSPSNTRQGTDGGFHIKRFGLRTQHQHRLIAPGTSQPDPSSPALRHLHHISRALLSISDHQPVPAYWLFIAFLQSQSGRSGKFPPVLFSQDRTEQVRSIYREVKATERILAESGDQGRLVAHRLKSLGIKLDDLLLGNFMSYFSDILPDQCLERIWDIILGGSRDIVSYTATALLIALRKKLEDATSGQELLEEAERGTLVKGLDMDAVVQTGITIWERSQPQYSIFRSGSSPGAGVGGAAGMQR